MVNIIKFHVKYAKSVKKKPVKKDWSPAENAKAEKWTKPEMEVMQRDYLRRGARALAKDFGKTPNAVRQKAMRMGLIVKRMAA